MKIGRAWPAVVLALFCLPLFIGLGKADLFGDEAIYSWGADYILTTGGWLIPRASPFPDRPFLEKPPLKFWVVAAGIKAGLPHDELGLRFWDALCGGVAFLYVFGIGRRLGGAACGATAVLILFVHRPLLFDHGLRSNNMEAPLVLSYCGGVFHYLRWASQDDTVRRRWLHPVAVALYFTLGFMTKFVAALFLPLVLGLASLLVPSYRTRLVRDWRIWLGAKLMALVLIVPWFVYCTVVFGREFWNVIVGAHVYTRFTSSLDPAHVHPWNHYFVQLIDALRRSGALWMVAAGSVLLVAETIRRRRADGLVVLMWFAVPIALISLGTSKLYHYAYPFLPPVALAGGFLVSYLWETVRPPIERALAYAASAFGRARHGSVSGDARRHGHGPGAGPAEAGHHVLRRLCLTLAALALFVTVWTLVNGSLVIRAGGTTLFQNRQLLRPGLVAAVLTVLGGWPEGVARMGTLLLILGMLPVPAYRGTLKQFAEETHLLRPLRDCIVRVAERPELQTAGPRGMYVDSDAPDYESPFNHQYSYYFRVVNPWKRPRTTPPALLARYVFDPAEQRPVLISEKRYQDFLRSMPGRESTPNLAVLESDVLLLLPGPYSICLTEIAATQRLP